MGHVVRKAAADRRHLPVLKGDARADRWREHRAAVRVELIEATLRAIDEYGPDLSIEEIIKTAGIPRPKLYRFFGDKDELFAAVTERVQELVVQRLTPHFALTGTVLGAVTAGLHAYVDLVDERPNLFRFIVGSQVASGRSPMVLLESGRPLSDAMAALVGAVLGGRGGDVRDIEYFVDAVLGAVGLAVLRWLNSPTIEKDELVGQLVTFVWGALSATAASRGVALAPDDVLTLPSQSVPPEA
ncbi:TetR family transcriptional regulator [Nocardia puris]|uniref:TetR family transcriptional regulator n=1 Tax=Nocardia puris TaxID=208602 RepID=A0A366DY64_9NOCA|nr:TetR family transcriptional regulator [Nocardia puris]